MTSQDHIKSGAQAVQDVSGAICKAAGDCLIMHGPDPNTPAILTAAFCMAIEEHHREDRPDVQATPDDPACGALETDAVNKYVAI